MVAFKATPAQLFSLADRLGSESKQIGSTLNELDQKVAALRAQWDGDAQRAYDDAQRSWNASADHINKILDEMSKRSRLIGERYAATDKNAAGRF